jgi:hypothetical protein
MMETKELSGLNQAAAARVDRGLVASAARLARGAYAVLALTTLHHVYGAWRYQTPFRLHVVAVAVVVAALVVVTHRLFLRKRCRFSLVAFAAATLLFPVLGIGVFEGAYNHVAKNVLYFAGTDGRVLLTLFPPPTYELPNDVFFELTGMLQVLPAAMTAQAFAVLLKRWRNAG